MKKYIRENVVYEAMHLTDESFEDCYEWISQLGLLVDFDEDGLDIDMGEMIETAYIGNYIVKRKSQVFVVDQEYFESNYEYLEN